MVIITKMLNVTFNTVCLVEWKKSKDMSEVRLTGDSSVLALES